MVSPGHKKIYTKNGTKKNNTWPSPGTNKNPNNTKLKIAKKRLMTWVFKHLMSV
jgi:hypothetical protein